MKLTHMMAAGALVILISAAQYAGAAGAWLTAPSVAPYGQQLEINGGGVEPGAILTVRITGPDKVEMVMNVTADAIGKFRLDYTSPLPGHYRAVLHDAAGIRLASADFGFAAP